MKIIWIFFAVVWLLAGCQSIADTPPAPTTTDRAAVPGWESTPAGKPGLTPAVPRAETGNAVKPGEEQESVETDTAWDTGGPGEAPKPELDFAQPAIPHYQDRLEPYSPFKTQPQLPELPTSEPETFVLLPDLYALPPYDLRLVYDDSTGRGILRFSNAVANLGPGALELRGKMDNSTGIVDVSQRIFLDSAEEADLYEENGVGKFDYHPEHEHWHWDGFSLYEVYTTLTDGTLGELTYSSDKVGYCLRDDRRLEEFGESHLADFPAQGRRYLGCGPTIQGLSVAWTDIYAHDTPGQWVDVTGLPEGEIYALRSTADPHNLIREVDDGNNSVVVYFRYLGNAVELVDSSQFANLDQVNE